MDSFFNNCCCHNQSWIQICLPACIMNSEFFAITPLYLVRLKNLWMDKIILLTFKRHLHQIQGNWAGRNFMSSSVNSLLVTYAGVQRWNWNLQLQGNPVNTVTNGPKKNLAVLIRKAVLTRVFSHGNVRQFLPGSQKKRPLTMRWL